MICPHCKNNDELRIRGKAWKTIKTKGNDWEDPYTYDDFEYDNNSECVCPECGWAGKVFQAGIQYRQTNFYELAVVRLEEGESINNPVCPSCKLHGPMLVEFRRYPDGGIDAKILEGDDGHANE